MHPFFATVFSICWSVLAGCAATNPSASGVAGDFRLGVYPDAQYLSLRADHSFSLRALDRSANGLDESAPPKVLILSGTWRLAHSEVILGDFSGPQPSGFTPCYALVGPDAAGGLQPLYGAGYASPTKFVRTPLPRNLTTRSSAPPLRSGR